MATKFYLPSTGTAPVDPAWSASWTDTTTASPSKLSAVTTKISSAMATKSVSGDTDLADKDFAYGMWVSGRLKPQAIAAQTVTISIKCSETAAKNNLYLHWIVRLLHANNTYGDTIVAFRSDNTEVVEATNTSRFDTLTSTAVTAVGGDRIVIEIGLGGDPQTGGHNGSVIIGDDAAADLDAADGDTGVDNPWVNFGTTTLAFMSDRVFVTHM